MSRGLEPGTKRGAEITALLVLLVLYVAVAAGLVLHWDRKGTMPLAGDEPHYLVLSMSIVRDRTLDQTVAFDRELRTNEFFLEGTDPALVPAHTRVGPRGRYSVHNIGLPLLILVPTAVGGVIAAKLFLVLLSSSMVWLVWQIAGLWFEGLGARFGVCLALTVALPAVPAAGQIFPDLPAGILLLMGFYWLMTCRNSRAVGIEAAWSLGLAFLPWLHLKFAVAALALAGSIALRRAMESHQPSRGPLRTAMPFCFVLASLGVLAAYFEYAFGFPLGPYESVMRLTPVGLMTLAGLHLDQNQGFLFHNPILFLGLAGLVPLFRWNRTLFCVWAVVFSSVIVPNGFFVNWYGGHSFSGRFSWSAALLFFVPTLMALAGLIRRRVAWFVVALALSCGLQLSFLVRAAYGVDVYNKRAGTPFESYPIYYPEFGRYLPAFYDPAIALSHVPNTVWLVVSTLLVGAGLFLAPVVRRA